MTWSLISLLSIGISEDTETQLSLINKQFNVSLNELWRLEMAHWEQHSAL